MWAFNFSRSCSDVLAGLYRICATLKCSQTPPPYPLKVRGNELQELLASNERKFMMMMIPASERDDMILGYNTWRKFFFSSFFFLLLLPPVTLGICCGKVSFRFPSWRYVWTSIFMCRERERKSAISRSTKRSWDHLSQEQKQLSTWVKKSVLRYGNTGYAGWKQQ